MRLPRVRSILGLMAPFTVTALAVMCSSYSNAQTGTAASLPEVSSLLGVKPLLPDTSDYIRDADAARQLGKALFWDTQAGSDGTACASCHFHAGADVRGRNQVNPGTKSGDRNFSTRPNGEVSGPNKDLKDTDFPFRRVSNPSDRESQAVFDTNDAVSSQGEFAGDFVSSSRGAVSNFIFSAKEYIGTTPRTERCNLSYDPANNPFHANGLIYRAVEPRHTPSVINAVFNLRQYWDGRASSQFNGVDPFGPRTYVPLFDDPNSPGVKIGNPNAAATGILVQGPDATKGVQLVKPLITNASLASQAVGPPLSDFDMACAGKTFADLGRKLLPLRPLSTQVVSSNDSLFGKTPGLVNLVAVPGLNTSYTALIQKAFDPKFWSGAGKYVVDPTSGAPVEDSANGFTQIEFNFSLFWGLAIQAYEQLLVSDDAPFDRGPAAMSPEALAGQEIFTGKGKCVTCHSGPLLSEAAVTSAEANRLKLIEDVLLGDGDSALSDHGFYNTGVRPSKEDPGIGGNDPYGFSLSFSRQYKWMQLGQDKKAPDHFDPQHCSAQSDVFPNCDVSQHIKDPASASRDAVDGAFKVPILRNVGLTPPYFHNGGQANLKDVVRFYNRGGDRQGPLGKDTTGLDTTTPFGVKNASNLDPEIGNPSNVSANNGLGLTETEMDNLVQFLLSLTDQRVACHSGVFDHPELPLIIGHKDVPKSGTSLAKDIVATLPAVGQKGLPTCFPNTGDLFGTLNRSDSRRLPEIFSQTVK